MNRSASHLRKPNLLAVLSTFGTLMVTGCGLGTRIAPSDSTLTAIQGVARGGQAPIQGALVRLYATDPSATAYGSSAVLIGSAITDQNGGFILNPAVVSGTNCPAGAQVYVTAAGGYPAGNANLTNGNDLEMAALGECSTVSSNTYVNVNELTTVAAAYALSGFMTTSYDATNKVYQANVSAPAANSGFAGSTATPITSTRPGGLGHAFQNANTLVNYATGLANTTVTSTIGTSAAYTLTGHVPAAELNTLADAMQSCVDSGASGGIGAITVSTAGSGYTSAPAVTITDATGSGAAAVATISGGGVVGVTVTKAGSGYSNAPSVSFTAAPSGGTTAVGSASVATVGASSTCGTLFALTPSISGLTPSNTLQAFINLARNPYPSSAAFNDSGNDILGLAKGVSAAFVPYLTASPLDYSMAVIWTTQDSTGANTSLTTYYLATGPDDTVYGSVNAPTTATPVLVAYSAYGAATPTFDPPSTVASTPGGKGVALDQLGNVWVAQYDSTVDRFSTSTGKRQSSYTSSSSSIWPLAVDASNNLWLGHGLMTSGSTILEEIGYNPTTGSYAFSLLAKAAAANQGPYGLAIDANQNVWPSAYYSGGTIAQLLPNLNVCAGCTPGYTASGTTGTLLTATLASSASKPYNTVFDASGNAWQTITGSGTLATTGIEEIIPSYTAGINAGNQPNSTITSITPQSAIFGSTVGSTAQGNTLGTIAAIYPAIDGAGTIFVPDNSSNTQGIHIYSTGTAASGATLPSRILSPTNGIKGCSLIASATTCGAVYASAVYSPRSVVIDSTGSVWSNNVAITGTTVNYGGYTQLIGLAAPAYPLLSIGMPGLEPGLTTVAPLP